MNEEESRRHPMVSLVPELEVFWIFTRILIFGLSTLYCTLYFSGYSGFSVYTTLWHWERVQDTSISLRIFRNSNLISQIFSGYSQFSGYSNLNIPNYFWIFRIFRIFNSVTLGDAPGHLNILNDIGIFKFEYPEIILDIQNFLDIQLCDIGRCPRALEYP